jgi:hypothetical protein
MRTFCYVYSVLCHIVQLNGRVHANITVLQIFNPILLTIETSL